MFSILRPFLFSLDPETAHDLAIKSLKFNYLPKKIFDIEIVVKSNSNIQKDILFKKLLVDICEFANA